MTGFTALELARIQFAFTMSFHILFPAVSIGLASYLAVLELSWLRTRQQVYVDLYHFWLRIFAVMFGMGVVSGIVMAYQIGTNWSAMSEFAGSIMGPILSYEVLTAFFQEAGFLGVMLFGWTRVGPSLHFLATCMVAIGTLISATWILAANSWMQTPQGYAVENGRMVPVDWLAIVFNPSLPYRFMHMVLAAYLATALIVAATGAWQLVHRRDSPAVRKMLVVLAIAALLRALKRDPHRLPFVAALALVFLGYTGMAISIWPHIVPPGITIWEASSPPASQGFALVGTLLILPIILMYTIFSYWVFRGKVKHGAGYH